MHRILLLFVLLLVTIAVLVNLSEFSHVSVATGHGRIVVLAMGSELDASDPAKQTFATVRRHADHPAITFTIRNVGDGALNIEQLTVPKAVKAEPAGPLTIAPNTEIFVELRLDTDEEHSLRADFLIESDDATLGHFRIPLQGDVEPYIVILREPHPEIDEFIHQFMLDNQVVGVGVAVARGQDIVYLSGFGFEDRDATPPVKVDPEQTRFRWASVSKGLTGVAALAASEKQLLELDAPVTNYLTATTDINDSSVRIDYKVPSIYLPLGCEELSCGLPLSAAQRTFSTRDLLGHTSGVRHYHNGIMSRDPAPPTSMTDDPAINTGLWWAIKATWGSEPLVTQPGLRHEYSTFGYNLVGVIIEQATSMPFDRWIDHSISKPLGMSTMQADYLWETIPRRSVGYTRDGTTVIADARNDVSWKMPGGGFISTVADFGRFCAGLQGDVVLSAKNREEELWRPQGPKWPELEAINPGVLGYGFGFKIEEDAVWHTGGQQGTATAMRFRPDENLCFVVMTNSKWVNPIQLVQGIDDAFVR